MLTLRVFLPSPTALNNETLRRFTTVLDGLEAQGIPVERIALAPSSSQRFPIVLAGDRVAATDRYPAGDQLAAWAGLEPSEAPSLVTDAVAELVAIAASVVANAETSFKAHVRAAEQLGVSRSDLLAVINGAQRVKNQASRAMLDVADRRLQGEEDDEDRPDGGCGSSRCDSGDGDCGSSRCGSSECRSGDCGSGDCQSDGCGEKRGG